MKHIFFVGLGLAGLFGLFVACQNNAPTPVETAVHVHTTGDNAHIYVCPMHLEVTKDQPGNCPKCNMALEERHLEATPNQYEMRFITPTATPTKRSLQLCSINS
ncbi:MAG: heavy metal-binding domain-containing protein [Saprospiraceae bacterium]|nr:heavy metal-binding domain-containing protein [Saprospiraceae bacterium]